MLPVEEKSSPRNLNLNLNLNGNVNGNNSNSNDASNKLLNSERASVLKNASTTSTTSTTTTTMIVHESQRPQILVNVSQPDVNDAKVQHDNNATSVGASGSILISTTSNADDSKKIKMSKIGSAKNVTLKRYVEFKHHFIIIARVRRVQFALIKCIQLPSVLIIITMRLVCRVNTFNSCR